MPRRVARTWPGQTDPLPLDAVLTQPMFLCRQWLGRKPISKTTKGTQNATQQVLFPTSFRILEFLQTAAVHSEEHVTAFALLSCSVASFKELTSPFG